MQNIQANFLLPRNLLDELRALVPRGKQSDVVSKALEHELRRMRFQQAMKESFGAWKKEAHPELSRGTSAYIRSSRKSSRGRRTEP